MAIFSTTYYPGGYQPAAPAQNMASQLTDTAYTTWDKAGNVTFTGPPTADQQAQITASQTAQTSSTNQATLQQRAQAALNTNATFLALANPSNAQNAAQVQALTKECSTLIRLLLGLLDSTSGT